MCDIQNEQTQIRDTPIGENGKIGQISLQKLCEYKYVFLIPSYQRGYRWRSKHVNALIHDLTLIPKDKTYCLQPIVLQKVSKNNNTFRVVDGQQRLTTIMLLLRGWGWQENTLWTMEYENNADNRGVLNASCRKNTSLIAENTKDTDREKICETLERVFFIWYLLDEREDGHAVFMRLNSGKIPLTSSELIRARLLGDQCRNPFEIAAEWERIEQRLRDDRFWFMFNSKPSESFTRIDRLFEIITQVEDKVKNDRLSPYYAVEKDDKPWWEKLLNLFWMLEQCYNNVELYHYIGWLRHFSQAHFLTLYQLYKGDKINFLQNLQKIIIGKGSEITVDCADAKKIMGISLVPVDDSLGQLIEENFQYENDPKFLRKFFVLFNIESLNQKIRNLSKDTKNKIEYERFPFDWYQMLQWNIEHIDSHTENPMEDPDEQVEWALETYIEQKEDEKDNNILAWLLQQLSDERYKQKINDWIKRLGIRLPCSQLCEKPVAFKDIYNPPPYHQSRIPDGQKNLPWNLTLLDEYTNKSYHNAIFPRKRRRIIAASQGRNPEEDSETHKKRGGADPVFIPPCTLNVFTKYYTTAAVKITEWTKTDASCYRKAMIDTFQTLIDAANSQEDEKCAVK